MNRHSLLSAPKMFTPTAISQLVLLSAIWGASFLFMKIGAPEFGPITLIFLRVLLGAVILAPLINWSTDGAVLTKKWFYLIMLGILNAAVPFTLFSYAELTISAGATSIINATAPIFLALVARIWLKQSLTKLQYVGLMVSLFGVFILEVHKTNILTLDNILALSAAILAAFMYGLAGNYAKVYLKDVNPLIIAAGAQFGATLALLPFVVFALPNKLPSLNSWLSVIALGILCTGIAFIIYFKLLNNIGPQKTITVTFLIPVFGVLWARLFLKETITVNMVFGALIIFLGIILSNRLIKMLRYRSN